MRTTCYLALLAPLNFSFGQESNGPTTSPSADPQPSLFDLTKHFGSLREFGNAIELSGLNETLDARGPFTMFLPNNAAFSRLDGRYLDPQYVDHLENLVLLHARFGATGVSGLAPGTELTMSNSETIEVSSSGQIWPSIGGAASITRSNLQADNGIAHILDDVLQPTFLTYNLGEFLEAGNMPTFVEAAKQVSIWNAFFEEAANFTLLLPTEKAMIQFEAENPELRKDTESLERIIKHHIVEKVFYINTEIEGKVIQPLSGEIYDIIFSQGKAIFGGEAGAAGTTDEINNLVRNGVIHVIDNVLISPEMQLTSEAPTISPTNLQEEAEEQENERDDADTTSGNEETAHLSLFTLLVSSLCALFLAW